MVVQVLLFIIAVLLGTFLLALRGRRSEGQVLFPELCQWANGSEIACQNEIRHPIAGGSIPVLENGSDVFPCRTRAGTEKASCKH